MRILSLNNNLPAYRKIRTKNKIKSNLVSVGYEHCFQNSYSINYPKISFTSTKVSQKELIDICKNSGFENYNSSKENMEQD